MPKTFKNSFTATLCFAQLKLAAKHLGSIIGILRGVPPNDGKPFVKRFAEWPTGEVMVSILVVLFPVLFGRAKHPSVSL